MKKHPVRLAWDKWLASEEGQSCVNPVTMGAHPKQQYYLSNRLWHAFTAGIAAQEKLSGAVHRPTAKGTPRRKAAAASV